MRLVVFRTGVTLFKKLIGGIDARFRERERDVAEHIFLRWRFKDARCKYAVV